MKTFLTRIAVWLRGFAVSRTMTFAIMLAVLGAIQMYVNVLRPLFHSQQGYGWFCLILAAFVGVLRAVTWQSIMDKGNAAINGTLPPSG